MMTESIYSEESEVNLSTIQGTCARLFDSLIPASAGVR